LFDHTKLILSDLGKTVTFIGKDREMSTHSLELFVARRRTDVFERVEYAVEVLAEMIFKKRQT
jgi:POLO box duplicated region